MDKYCVSSEPGPLLGLKIQLQLRQTGLSSCAWLSWLEHHPVHQKVAGLISQSGHIPMLWVRSPVELCMGSNRSMFLSHIDLSLFLSLSASLSLFQINKYPQLRIKKDRLVSVLREAPAGWEDHQLDNRNNQDGEFCDQV